MVPLLQERLRVSNNLLEKFHVLWTLEGLGALDAATVRQQMEEMLADMRSTGREQTASQSNPALAN